eukprot:CAMPEP_0194384874 /NCGR_PEP_ID=MMETSP0174-20130528/76697_1 /TAXON_ID=216777 /ORGANISM="Proboscia alata, Strain PI-D3" /LENGTH=762 /DNA_ID=CAMNT_0039172445 /DNA_START=33 /DNA_END=2321 /DNA_ORIENTATION=+
MAFRTRHKARHNTHQRKQMDYDLGIYDEYNKSLGSMEWNDGQRETVDRRQHASRASHVDTFTNNLPSPEHNQDYDEQLSEGAAIAEMRREKIKNRSNNGPAATRGADFHLPSDRPRQSLSPPKAHGRNKETSIFTRQRSPEKSTGRRSLPLKSPDRFPPKQNQSSGHRKKSKSPSKRPSTNPTKREDVHDIGRYDGFNGEHRRRSQRKSASADLRASTRKEEYQQQASTTGSSSILTNNPSLTWRLDPDESLSDWTIVVMSAEDQSKESTGLKHAHHTSSDDESNYDSINDGSSRDDQFKSNLGAAGSRRGTETKSYHVHRTQLGVGQRRSEYFARLFRSKRSNPGDATVSRFELQPSAADAFATMLDYIYTIPGSPLGEGVNSESAVALRHLATCFGIRSLFTDVTEFIQQDLNIKTAPVYLSEASIYNHDKLKAASIKLCAIHFESIKLSKMVSLDPPLFEDIVCSKSLKCGSEMLSSRVASYCRCRPTNMSASYLRRLTENTKRMPRIAHDEAIFLIRLMVDLEMIPHMFERENTADAAAGNNRLRGDTTLYNRCVVASTETVLRSVKEPKPSDVDDDEDRMPHSSAQSQKNAAQAADYNSLPPTVKIHLLEEALKTTDSPPTQKKLQPEVQSFTHDDDDILIKEGNPKLMRRAFEQELAAYRNKLASKEEEIRRYASELKKFARVPNEYQLPQMVADFTFKSEPELDRYGESIYGTIPPTAMPRTGRSVKNGWLYRENQWNNENGDTKLWPMFYYKAN